MMARRARKLDLRAIEKKTKVFHASRQFPCASEMSSLEVLRCTEWVTCFLPDADRPRDRIDTLQSKKPIVNGCGRNQFDAPFGRRKSTTLEDAFLDVEIACW
ncbi:unnamed protein product [Echinostoma caproni]|uniref:Uncharacterized protein n=1 Tax=Echinostoma caproni TaxID=27848 RepID=A0A183A6S3_9TREM|nr:unnamed protein product [Echinostoma caproni]